MTGCCPRANPTRDLPTHLEIPVKIWTQIRSKIGLPRVSRFDPQRAHIPQGTVGMQVDIIRLTMMGVLKDDRRRPRPIPRLEQPWAQFRQPHQGLDKILIAGDPLSMLVLGVDALCPAQLQERLNILVIHWLAIRSTVWPAQAARRESAAC